MRSGNTGVAMCLAVLLLAGCNKQPAAKAGATPADEAPVTSEATVAEGGDGELPATDEEATPGKISKRDAISMGVAMTAVGELCGVGNALERKAALAAMKAQPGGPSAAEVDMIYAAAIQQGKAQQAQDPAEFEKNCVGMRKMADPAEVKKMEQALKELEAAAAEIEAEAKAE